MVIRPRLLWPWGHPPSLKRLATWLFENGCLNSNWGLLALLMKVSCLWKPQGTCTYVYTHVIFPKFSCVLYSIGKIHLLIVMERGRGGKDKLPSGTQSLDLETVKSWSFHSSLLHLYQLAIVVNHQLITFHWVVNIAHLKS